MLRNPVTAIVSLVAAAVLLGSCSGTPDAEPAATSPEPSVSATAEPSPMPTSEPTADPMPTLDPHPALTELLISTSGLGPLTVGAIPPATNAGAAMIEWDAEYCADFTEPGGEPGRWRQSGYSDDTNYDGQPVTPFYVDATDAGVHWIDILGVSPSTAAGIRIGSTLPELQAAYPALMGPFEGPISQVWWIEDASGILVFETQGDADGMRPAGTPESVILIRVLQPGSDPEFATANSDLVAGGCL